MAINANVLSFVAGAAEQFTKNKDEFKKELRENKRRQRDWINTYGNKVLNENKQQEESVTAALKQLESRGLAQPDVLQLMQRHGVEAVLQLQKYVNEYESKNDTTIDAELMNKVWKAADDFTLTSDNYGDAVSKVFGTNKAGATAPVIQEAEERSFFDKIKANLSGDYEDEEYADFLDDPTEGIGDQSINDLRRMAAASPSMLGTDGSAVFDRSALRGSESTSAERASWKDLKKTIIFNTLANLDPTLAKEIRIIETMDGEITRNIDDQWNMLRNSDQYKEALEEATRNAAQGIDLGSNRAAWNSYGGQDALNAILNPLTLEQELENRELNREDLKEFNTVEEVTTYFAENPNVEFAIVGDEFAINKNYNPAATTETVDEPPVDPTVDAPELPVEEGTYNTDDLTLKAQPTVAPEGIPKRPEPIYRGEEKKLFEKPRNKTDIDDWDDQYGDKYNPDATYKIVRPQGPRPEDINSREYYEYELWDATYGDTHDPLTGYPLIEGLDKTLIPNSGVAN